MPIEDRRTSVKRNKRKKIVGAQTEIQDCFENRKKKVISY